MAGFLRTMDEKEEKSVGDERLILDLEVLKTVDSSSL